MTVNRSLLLGLVLAVAVAPALAADSLLHLRATAVTDAIGGPWSIELFRWSSEAERGPLLTALAAPAPALAAPSVPETGRAAAAGRAGRGGRGGRGGREGGPTVSPIERLAGAVKAAPTVGYIWGGITGYSIRYAWHAPAADGIERVVLVTDRRLDAASPSTGDAAPAGEFTVIEMLIDPKGVGEAKTSLTTPVVVDAAAQTLALDGYRAAPALLKVTR